MGKPKEIFDGFFNLVKDELDLLDKQTRNLAVTRSSICAQCPANVNKVCSADVQIKDLITEKMEDLALERWQIKKYGLSILII